MELNPLFEHIFHILAPKQTGFEVFGTNLEGTVLDMLPFLFLLLLLVIAVMKGGYHE